jgi:hypothetical protein
MVRVQERIALRTAPAPTEPGVSTDPPASAPAETPPPIAATPPAQPPVAATPPAQPPVDDPRHSDPAYWKHRFSVVEGQIRVREGELRSARDTNAALQQRVTTLEDEIRKLQDAAPRAPIDITQWLTPEMIEKYGEEQCQVMASLADRVADSRVRTQVEAQVKPLREAREREVVDRKQERVNRLYGQLDELVPGWRTTDVDPAFGVWLSMVDPATRIQRQKMLNEYVHNGDAEGAASLFRAYDASLMPPAAAPVPVPPVVPHGGGASGAAPIAAPTPAEVQGLTPLSPREIQEFYKRASLDRNGDRVSAEDRARFEARLAITPRRGKLSAA